MATFSLGDFLKEARRRRVFRFAAIYIVGAWITLQVADLAFPGLGIPESAIRYVWISVILGMPVALVFSWRYDIRDGRIVRTVLGDSDADLSIGRIDIVILGALSIVVTVIAFGLIGEVSKTRVTETVPQMFAETNPNSIAVLPFADLSPDGNQEYFSDGLSEEILNLLTKVPDLQVTSRSSAFSFKGQNVDVPTIAARLNVAHVLEGSVRKSGNQLRITAQLIDVESDTHLWSQTYDRELENIFAIQDEIAATVVKQLKVTLLGEVPHVEETDPEAYSLSLLARHWYRQTTVDGYEKSIALFEQALAIDPNYANAWNGLASNYSFQANLALRPYDEGYTMARGAAEKALAIDPDYASAHARLGEIAMAYDNDLAAAARHFARAITLNPTDTGILSDGARLLVTLGRQELAIPVYEYVTLRDPVHLVSHIRLGHTYIYAGRWDEAIDTGQTALRISPDSTFAHSLIGTALLFKGESAAALEANQQGGNLVGMAMAYHALGDADASDETLAELIEKYEQPYAFQIAYVLAYRDEVDRAFEWLDKAVEYGDPGLLEIVVEPAFGDITSDPRWLPFLESIGMSPAQLDAISFEVQLPQ